MRVLQRITVTTLFPPIFGSEKEKSTLPNSSQVKTEQPPRNKTPGPVEANQSKVLRKPMPVTSLA
jgi:hypothetical protein